MALVEGLGAVGYRHPLLSGVFAEGGDARCSGYTGIIAFSHLRFGQTSGHEDLLAVEGDGDRLGEPVIGQLAGEPGAQLLDRDGRWFVVAATAGPGRHGFLFLGLDEASDDRL